MRGTRPPAEKGQNPRGNVASDVAVYFPAHEPGVVYVQTSGTWIRYERSDPCPEAGIEEQLTEQLYAVNGSKIQEPAPDNHNLHWAGHRSGSSQELIRKRRPRVYYDPQKHPGLLETENGAAAAPLPDLELNGHLEDPEPWLDPTSGTRFTGEQARTATAILTYAPRKDQSTRRDGEDRQKVRLEPMDTFTQATAPTSPLLERLQGSPEEASFSR